MNVLFLTIGTMEGIEDHSMYPDMIRYFRNQGHSVYVVARREKRNGLPTELVEAHGTKLLHVRIGNITKCKTLEKGISTLMIKRQYLDAIKKYFPDVCFDLILYTTPPITLVGVVEYIKKRDNAMTYLLLKDIFPQNAVDIGMLKGAHGIVYRYFRRKEKRLYSISDYIGCMSDANVDYVIKHNPEVSSEKVEVSPNVVELVDYRVDIKTRLSIREKYNIPTDKKVFIYGGNLGKPQGIGYIIECMQKVKGLDDAYFLIIGDGTEYNKLEAYINREKQKNLVLMKRLPKEDYDKLVAACDIGLIFLDHRFTIPNFPSRLLAYMQAGIPILACTDPNTDVGKVITEGGFGWWCESDDSDGFVELVSHILKSDTEGMGDKGYKYLDENYTIEKAYNIIMKHFTNA